MKVRTLVGRLAGEIVDMEYVDAQNCIANGTACLPEDAPKVKGLRASSAAEVPELPFGVVPTIDAGVDVEVEVEVAETGTATVEIEAETVLEGMARESADKVSVPSNWNILSATERRDIAEKISGVRPKTGKAADAIIKDYLAAQ
jgi:hypothetical protein